MNFSKYLHSTTQRWISRVMFLTGETISEDDAMLVDRTVRELWNSSFGGANAAPRATGTSLFVGRKVVAWYPKIGPTIEAARVPVINTTDPRDWLNTTPIGHEMLVERYDHTQAYRKNRFYRSDLGARSNPVGGGSVDNDLFYRTGITVTKLNAANTLQGLTSGCLSFGFSLNSTPAAGAGILGTVDPQSFYASIDTGGQLRAGMQTGAGAWDISVAGATITPAAYVVSRRANNNIRALKDGAQIHQRTATDTPITTSDVEIALLCVSNATPALPAGNRYTGYVSDIWFGLQLTADEELAISDIFARHRARRLNS